MFAAVILEDDLEVSPVFYKWLKRALDKVCCRHHCRFFQDCFGLVQYGHLREMVGISLQKQFTIPGAREREQSRAAGRKLITRIHYLLQLLRVMACRS